MRCACARCWTRSTGLPRRSSPASRVTHSAAAAASSPVRHRRRRARRCVRVQRGEARHRAGRHLPVRAREDRPERRAPLLRHRRAVRCGHGAADPARPRGRLRARRGGGARRSRALERRPRCSAGGEGARPRPARPRRRQSGLRSTGRAPRARRGSTRSWTNGRRTGGLDHSALPADRGAMEAPRSPGALSVSCSSRKDSSTRSAWSMPSRSRPRRVDSPAKSWSSCDTSRVRHSPGCSRSSMGSSSPSIPASEPACGPSSSAGTTTMRGRNRNLSIRPRSSRSSSRRRRRASCRRTTASSGTPGSKSSGRGSPQPKRASPSSSSSSQLHWNRAEQNAAEAAFLNERLRDHSVAIAAAGTNGAEPAPPKKRTPKPRN